MIIPLKNYCIWYRTVPDHDDFDDAEMLMLKVMRQQAKNKTYAFRHTRLRLHDFHVCSKSQGHSMDSGASQREKDGWHNSTVQTSTFRSTSGSIGRLTKTKGSHTPTGRNTQTGAWGETRTYPTPTRNNTQKQPPTSKVIGPAHILPPKTKDVKNLNWCLERRHDGIRPLPRRSALLRVSLHRVRGRQALPEGLSVVYPPSLGLLAADKLEEGRGAGPGRGSKRSKGGWGYASEKRGRVWCHVSFARQYDGHNSPPSTCLL